MTSENTTFAQEIAHLVARGIQVLTLDRAMDLANILAVFLEDDYPPPARGWYLVSIQAINGEGPIVIVGRDEVDRLYEEILDFNDRLTAGLIRRDSIHIITVNTECNPQSAWGLPSIALVGDWEPAIQITVPGVEEDMWLNPERFEGPASSGVEPASDIPVYRFINEVDSADIEKVMISMDRPANVLYEQVMTGLIKPVTRWLPNDEAVQKVENLKREMPHLGDFFDEVLIAMNLAIRFNADRFTLPPMILNGPPGIGKTFGLFALAEVLDLSMEAIPMSTTGAGFILSGSERGWRDPVPGLLAKSAAKSRHINPIFILDEFEKATFKRDSGMNGLEPEVLQMLERDSAKCFRDVFLEQDLNLSEISYIGSSNTTHQIPEPILSRVKVIEVGYPPVESLQQLYSSILNRSLQEDLGIDGITVSVSGNFSDHTAAGISPRLIRNNARRILSSALKNAQHGDFIEIQGCALLSSIHFPAASLTRGIGFLANL